MCWLTDLHLLDPFREFFDKLINQILSLRDQEFGFRLLIESLDDQVLIEVCKLVEKCLDTTRVLRCNRRLGCKCNCK